MSEYFKCVVNKWVNYMVKVYFSACFSTKNFKLI